MARALNKNRCRGLEFYKINSIVFIDNKNRYLIKNRFISSFLLMASVHNSERYNKTFNEQQELNNLNGGFEQLTLYAQYNNKCTIEAKKRCPWLPKPIDHYTDSSHLSSGFFFYFVFSLRCKESRPHKYTNAFHDGYIKYLTRQCIKKQSRWRFRHAFWSIIFLIISCSFLLMY